MSPSDNDGGLVRELNWVHSAAVIIGTMLGAGIFVVTAQVAGIMGPDVPIGSGRSSGRGEERQS